MMEDAKLALLGLPVDGWPLHRSVKPPASAQGPATGAVPSPASPPSIHLPRPAWVGLSFLPSTAFLAQQIAQEHAAGKDPAVQGADAFTAYRATAEREITFLAFDQPLDLIV